MDIPIKEGYYFLYYKKPLDEDFTLCLVEAVIRNSSVAFTAVAFSQKESIYATEICALMDQLGHEYYFTPAIVPPIPPKN